MTLRLVPPRRQVVRNGKLAWEEIRIRSSLSQEAIVLKHVRAVRNNLFHGGKYPDGPIEELERNRDLLRAALTVIEACFEAHQALKRWDEAAA